MPEITDATILRRTVRFAEGERPEFKAGARTTIVVKRAVFEVAVGGNWDFTVYGYRKERSWVAPGEDESWSRRFTSHRPELPLELHPVFELARR